MKLCVSFLALLFSTISWATQLPTSGIYDNPGGRNYQCSIQLTYHESTNQLDLQMVNKANGIFCSNPLAIAMDCATDPVIDYFYCNGIASEGSRTSVVINSPSSITLSSQWSIWNLGSMVRVSDEVAVAKKYLSKMKTHWLWGGLSPLTCSIPRYNAVVPCRKIPYDFLSIECPDLQKPAEGRALELCESIKETGACAITRSSSNVFQGRLSGDLLGTKESGCEWTAIAE